MIDYKFVPETLDWCKEHYVPPIKEHIHCEDFGYSDGMNGGQVDVLDVMRLLGSIII